ncbi:hypothetical protein Bca4012_056089 [Brassica carinata]
MHAEIGLLKDLSLSLEQKDVTDVCMLHLYNYLEGAALTSCEQKARNLLADVETKGLQNFTEDLLGSNVTEGKTN